MTGPITERARAGSVIAPPFTAIAVPAEVRAHVRRVCHAERVTTFLEHLCSAATPVIAIIEPDATMLREVRCNDGAASAGIATSALVRFNHQVVALVRAQRADVSALNVAPIAALWLEDLLALEAEIGSLTQEVVHSYEELHLLYELGAALAGVLDIRTASDLIVQAMLVPLGAGQATLILNRHGHDEVVAQASHPAYGNNGSGSGATATSALHINGEIIGSLRIDGKLDADEFNSGDLKLLEGVAFMAAPTLWAAQLYEAARRRADTDGLTGIDNHRRLQERLDHELERARLFAQPMSIILADLDNFKLFNDLYGHPVGDRVLQTVSESLTTSIRANDVVGRYGGDEFLLLLPDTDAAGALEVAKRVLDELAGREVLVNDERLPLNLSLGIACYPADAATKHELIAHADTALYESKRSGGGTVRVSTAPRNDWLALHGNTFSVLEGLVQTVDAKDHYTREHSEVVTEAALILAQQLNLSEETRRALRIAGLLHDVGKIGIPDSILKKPGRLTAQEYEIMKQHVRLSEMIIQGVPHLNDVLDAVSQHHERFDGHGYPAGKREHQISLLGRIMAIADAYSAMHLDRPYRKGLTWAEIRVELERGAGTQFDPALVPLFVAAMEQLQ